MYGFHSLEFFSLRFPFCYTELGVEVARARHFEQYNGRFLPDIVLLTLSYYYRGTRLNAMKSFCLCSLCSYQNILTIFPLPGDAQKVSMWSDFF